MKKTLLLCGMLLAISATVASAAGVNLAWDACGGPDTKVFTCTTNSGSNSMVASVYPPAGQDNWIGFESYIELQSDGAALPLWWQMKNAGSCRSAASVLTASASGFGGTCQDAYQGLGNGGVGSYQTNYGGANRARIVVGFAIAEDPANPVVLDPSLEYGAAKVTISNAKTVGTGSCAGCNVGVCLVLTQVISRQPAGSAGGDATVSNSAIRNWVKWQAPTQVTCNGATPSHKSTWGSVKSLYR